MKHYNQPKELTLQVNGEERTVFVRPSDTLLRTLREGLGLTGTKVGCENGDCGSCTVQINGRPVKSCYTLTVDAADAEITTIEGLKNTPVQIGFIEEYGFQCGFCTPGQIVNAEALLRTNPEADDETVREWMESNLCRCTGYEGIERAIRHAKGQIKQQGAN